MEHLPDKVADAAEQVHNAFDETITAAKDWIDEPQLVQRERNCRREQGAWTERIVVSACTDGVAELAFGNETQMQQCASGTGGTYEYQCLHRNEAGEVYFNDGPSHPTWMQAVTTSLDVSWDIGRWNSLFWQAAVNHDYCYHHNDASRGFTQKDCDEQLLADLSAICQQSRFAEIPWFSTDVCKRHAAVMFATVRREGETAWNSLNTDVAYPTWRPLWQTYGMESDATDTVLKQQVEDALRSMRDLGL